MRKLLLTGAFVIAPFVLPFSGAEAGSSCDHLMGRGDPIEWMDCVKGEHEQEDAQKKLNDKLDKLQEELEELENR